MSDIDPSEVIQWFRQKSKEFGDIANTLERTFKPGTNEPNVATRRRTRRRILTENPGDLTAESIIKLINSRGRRVADLAEHFGVSEENVRKVIDLPSNNLSYADRGWVKEENPSQKEIF